MDFKRHSSKGETIQKTVASDVGAVTFWPSYVLSLSVGSLRNAQTNLANANLCGRLRRALWRRSGLAGLELGARVSLGCSPQGSVQRGLPRRRHHLACPQNFG